MPEDEISPEQTSSNDMDFIKEHLNPETLRAEVSARLRAGRPLNIWRKRPNGDNMISAWSYYLNLQKLCEEEGIEQSQINLKIIPENDFHDENIPDELVTAMINHGGLMFTDDKEDLYDLTYRMRVVTGEYQDMSKRRIFDAHLYNISKALGTDLPVDAADHIPQPLALESTPFAHFDKQVMGQLAQAIKEQAGGKRIITVVQSGSAPEKRFSDEQIIDLVNFVKKHTPDAYIMVVSDKAFQSDPIAADIQVYEDTADKCSASQDINETSAHLYASDTILTTDSFWGWLSAGIHAMKNATGKLGLEDDINILYTIGPTEIWAIPGTHTIKSNTLQACEDANKPIEEGVFHVDDYREIAGLGANRMIAPQDIEVFKQNIDSSLKK